MNASVCPGCGGKKIIEVRVQQILNHRRICVMQDDPCPICEGTGEATERQAQAWFAREFPEVTAYKPLRMHTERLTEDE
jgi:hypothetical protein